MNLKVVSMSMLFTALTAVGCNDNTKKENTDTTTSEEKVVDMHTSEISLDYAGTYQGVLPCADCEGIKTSIELKNDNTFTSSMSYLGKESKTEKQTGTYSWNEDGNKITLNNDANLQFAVGESRLTKLDNSGAVIEGTLADKYILKKKTMITDNALTNKKWKLVTLMGKPVAEIGKVGTEPFIEFNTEEGRVFGNSGCNSFSGTYSLKEGNRFGTSQMISTRKACMDMTVETQFLGVLQKADTYIIKDGVLSITKARMAPLATFEFAE
ncbi:copper resistance protein NlpE N-terminal domain-containing protein [Joostella sp. CR20]